MKAVLLGCSLLAIFSVSLALPSAVGNRWWWVFPHGFVATSVSNFAVSNQQPFGSWVSRVISIRGKDWGFVGGGQWRYKTFRVLYVAMPFGRLCRAFVHWPVSDPASMTLHKVFGLDAHGRSQCW